MRRTPRPSRKRGRRRQGAVAHASGSDVPAAIRLRLAAVLVLALAAASLHAQPADVGATATPVPADRTTVWLHDRDGLRVRLAVVGPAPLRVELPPQLLDADSELNWAVRPAGPPALKPLGGGREEWAQEFRLGPFAFGKAVRVGFAPVKVTAGGDRPRDVTAAAFEVRVRSRFDGEDGQPKLDPESARAGVAITGIEQLPPRPPDPPEPTGWLIVLGAAAVVAVGVVVGIVRRSRRKPKPLPPVEWAAAELDRLEQVGGAELAERLAAVLREFVARRFGIPAPRLTTGELLVAAGKAEWPAEPTAELGAVLDRCDRAKFAGDPPDADEGRELVARGRAWVLAHAPPA